MAHDEKIRALISRITERELLVHESSAQTVLSNLQALGAHFDDKEWCADLSHPQTDEEFFAEGEWGRPYTVVNGVLQIPVMGMLVNRFTRQLGSFITGYQYIERAYNRGMDDPNVRGIAFVVDSTGGEAAGNFELVDKLYKRRGEKPVRSFVADRALSGGYSIASVAPTVVITRSGSAGSIGVVTMHVNMAERLEQMGVEVTFIFAGKHKVDGNRFEKLSKDAKSRIQARIDKTYAVFVETVARNRNLSEDAVRGTEALVYDSDDAIEVGLADRIGALEDEMVAFSTDLDRDEDGDEHMTQDAKKTAAEPNADTVSKADHETAVEQARKDAIAAERKRVADVTGSEHYAGREKLAQSLLNTDLPAEQIVAALENAPKAEAPKVETTEGKDEKTGLKGGGDQFAEYMNKDGHPNVGSEVEGADAEQTDTAKNVAGILGAYSAMTGETFGDKKKAH